jgi:hypothetical protein
VVRCERLVDGEPILLGRALDQGDVGLARDFGSELVGEADQIGFVLREEQDARGLEVEPVGV